MHNTSYTIHTTYSFYLKATYNMQNTPLNTTHTHTYTHTHEMAGTEEGKQLIYPHLGNEAEGFDAPGDLILIVSLLPHFLFRREGHDLLYTGVPFYNDDVT